MKAVGTGNSAVTPARKSGILIFERTSLESYHGVKLDITDPSDSQSAIVIALDRFRRVDMLWWSTTKGIVDLFEKFLDSQIRTQIGSQFLRLGQFYEDGGGGGHE